MNAIEALTDVISRGGALPGGLSGCEAYPKSLHEAKGALFFIARADTSQFLIIATKKPEGFEGFEGEALELPGVPAIKCPLSPANARALMRLFPFAAPSRHGDAAFSMGLGDRLGLASPGHIRAIAGRGVFPVLAQQSMRELKLTGRTYEEVLAAASFAVFCEDWRGGWGADGDHLKTAEEIRYALGCGYTMITLDCSEHIGSGFTAFSAFGDSEQTALAYYEKKYAGQTFRLGDIEIRIGPEMLKGIVLTYARAIDHALRIYRDVIAPCGRPVDFEMSVDETSAPTAPEAHFIVAKELADGGARVSSLAPRFAGEFQKGIDYIGDIARFEREFIVHERIAEHFGYRLSIHSGSDKFAVFGVIGRHTGFKVHVKTAGTNWLEALRVVARNDPALFRELLAFALEHFQEARAYYHVGAEPSRVAPLSSVPDEKLEGCLDAPDARQILHITYGLLLQAKDPDNSLRFKDRLYALLHQREEDYARALEKHIGKHIDSLTTPSAPAPLHHGDET